MELFYETGLQAKSMALIPEIDLVKMFEDCFNIDVGLFSIKLGLSVRLFSSYSIGTGFISTFEFRRW